jgi:chemotaxis protein CheD
MPKPDPIIEIFLQPGELYFGDRHIRIRTLLGSCVSLVFWHPRRQIGGMCHYLLPSRKRPASVLDGRYGDEAIALMLREIRAAGAEPKEFQIRLFGGGNMFPGVAKSQARLVGRKNVEAARALIQAYRLAFSEEHVEGEGHRSLLFDISSGHVSLRHLPLCHGVDKR